jgi:multicomponent Na+:H+ antiporter subunit E
MNRAAAILGLIIPITLLYLIYTGSFSLFEIILGVTVSVLVGILFADVVVEHPGKLYNPVRWFWLIVYGLYYLTIIEAKAHWSVIKLIFNPKSMRPGIVRIPYYVKSDYAAVTIANSITNTPGTVVVDIDEKGKKMYVHWIKIEDETDEGARKHVSETFEKYSSKIFD